VSSNLQKLISTIPRIKVLSLEDRINPRFYAFRWSRFVIPTNNNHKMVKMLTCLSREVLASLVLGPDLMRYDKALWKTHICKEVFL